MPLLALLALTLAAPPPAPTAPATAPATSTTHYWDQPRAGANLFNEIETRERLDAAYAAGIELVRIAPDKWRGAGRDFLLGDADDFQGIPPGDLARLRAVLDDAHAARVHVVVTMLSLPGARWKQHNGDRNDFRLYLDEKMQQQAARFWGELAAALKGHPALVGYNVLNEPRPERDKRARGVDVNAIYAQIVRAIREVDAGTTIILDGTDDASPDGLARLRPIEGDANVVYAFHCYEPWPYIDHRGDAKLAYPGVVGGTHWDRAQIERALQPVLEWQRTHSVPSSRIWLEEFGVPRTKRGAAQWLADVVDVAAAHGWHWSFYSFREDTWDAMDYELGTAPLGAAYWEARERGEVPDLSERRATGGASWDALSCALARRPSGPGPRAPAAPCRAAR